MCYSRIHLGGSSTASGINILVEEVLGMLAKILSIFNPISALKRSKRATF